MNDRIGQIRAFLIEDENGHEGVVGFMSPYGPMPMVTHSQDTYETMYRMATEAASQIGRPIKVVRFAVRSDLETIEPKGEFDVHED